MNAALSHAPTPFEHPALRRGNHGRPQSQIQQDRFIERKRIEMRGIHPPLLENVSQSLPCRIFLSMNRVDNRAGKADLQ